MQGKWRASFEKKIKREKHNLINDSVYLISRFVTSIRYANQSEFALFNSPSEDVWDLGVLWGPAFKSKHFPFQLELAWWDVREGEIKLRPPLPMIGHLDNQNTKN